MKNYDEAAAEAARDRQDELTKPPGSLGRLEELAIFMAGWQGRAQPRIERAQALVFAGNHGVTAQGVNPYPVEVTAQMVANFENGGAAINQLCRLAGADLQVVALDLDRPTADFTRGMALEVPDLVASIQTGKDAVDPKADVIILGEMGIGNSTVAAARVSSRPMVSPSLSNGAFASTGLGGLTETNTSPSGVAERNSAVVPRGRRTPSMMRRVVTAV